MVRLSSATSRGTAYWFVFFCYSVSQVFRLRMHKFFELQCLSRKKKCNEENEGNNKLDRGVYAALPL